MHSITFECEVITPMFLYGADQQKPEIRAASIRGAMRWWFRAVCGGLVGGNAQKVHEYESALFGSTDSGQSLFTLRVLYNHSDKNISDHEPLPHKKKDNGQPYFTLRGINTGTKFQVILQKNIRNSEKENIEKSEKALNCAISIFELLSCLGGLGKRSRRGFGAFKINKVTCKESINSQAKDCEFFCKFQSVDNDYEKVIKQVIKNAIDSVEEFIKSVDIKYIKQYLSYPALPTRFPVIYEEAQTKTYEIRLGNVQSYELFIKTEMTQIHSNIGSLQGNVRGFAKGEKRQASTMLVSFIGLMNGETIPVSTQFFCRNNNSANEMDFTNIRNFQNTKLGLELISLEGVGK